MSMNAVEAFRLQRESEIAAQGEDAELKALSRKWFDTSCRHNYCYHFSWLGRPIIQYPQDIVEIQETLWRVKPDLVIECGIAHGGSLILTASILAMIDYCEAAETGVTLDPKKKGSKVLGIDIDIRKHNRSAIETHPLRHKIEMIQGSSIDPDLVARVREIASGFKNVMVVLDSHHSHSHVLAELEAYADLTTIDSFCIVLDTAIEDMPPKMHDDRPWGPGDSPKTAVWKFLEDNTDFEIQHEIDNKLLLSAGPQGFLKRIR